MPFLLVLIGAVLIVAAYRNTAGQLGSELQHDVSGFGVWGLAVIAVAGLQWVPGAKVPARWLLALVLLVIVLRNYQAALAGFSGLAQAVPASTAAATPASQYVASANSPGIASANISGGGSVGAPSAGGLANANSFMLPHVAQMTGAYDPAAFLTQYEQGMGGFGGVA